MTHSFAIGRSSELVGDKCVPLVPAGGVTEPWLDLYAEFFGRQFDSFTRDGCRFIFLNSPVLNSGLPIEQEQRQWFEAECAQAGNDRLFLRSEEHTSELQ